MERHKPDVDESFEDTPFGFDPTASSETPPTPPKADPTPTPKPGQSDPPAGDEPAEGDEAAPEGDTVESALAALADVLKDIPEQVGEAVTKAVGKTPTAPAKEQATPSEIDSIMETLEDQPEELRTAVRTALERGARLEAVLENMQQTASEQSLIGEIAELAKAYPGLTEADVRAVLAKTKELGEENPALADALELEEIAVRAIGRKALDSRRVKAPVPSGGKPKTGEPAVPAGKPKPAAAQIVADATPGTGSDKPYDPGPGNDFSDIARHITETAGESLVIRK